MPTGSNIARLPIGTLFFVPRLEKERELDREKGVGWDVSREKKLWRDSKWDFRSRLLGEDF